MYRLLVLACSPDKIKASIFLVFGYVHLSCCEVCWQGESASNDLNHWNWRLWVYAATLCLGSSRIKKLVGRMLNFQSITKYNKDSVFIDYNSASFDKRIFCSDPVFVEKAGFNYLM